jgi:hypothetical protein
MLCHTAGSAYYELNRLTDCRKHWTKMMDIRETLLPEDDLEVSDAMTSASLFPQKSISEDVY